MLSSSHSVKWLFCSPVGFGDFISCRAISPGAMTSRASSEEAQTQLRIWALCPVLQHPSLSAHGNGAMWLRCCSLCSSSPLFQHVRGEKIIIPDLFSTGDPTCTLQLPAVRQVFSFSYRKTSSFFLLMSRVCVGVFGIIQYVHFFQFYPVVLGLKGTTTFPHQGDSSSMYELVSYLYKNCLFLWF